MKKIIIYIAGFSAIALFFAFNINTQAANSNSSGFMGNKLQCFSGIEDGYNGTCTLIRNGAEINTVDENDDANDNYAGVYIYNSNLAQKYLIDVNKLSFNYSGDVVSGGSPRISVPIDENSDGDWEGFAFIDAVGCNGSGSISGTVDPINDQTCLVYYNNTPFDNWTDFANQNPTFKIASNTIAFIVVDQPGEYTISNVQLGRGPAKSK
jgi:hypothetical protein